MVEPVAARVGVDAPVAFQRKPISGGDFIMLEPIAVSIITAPAKFSALLANASEPVCRTVSRPAGARRDFECTEAVGAGTGAIRHARRG
ncbi:hypothetical protein KDW23_19460 [Burkholderia cenocepacia]|uniref:hypothetical protein n=1 Tax=Burkholderia cenocepacia TaxID=95486 RepID=UPI001B94B9DD|nr:hypothetical protein [Burkholderia cenocepacia]MBR8072156.1 hypothetical protein [Burkholderia cenocepacia]MBR8446888.1 hypothetical protein [Burkholderia cenocepacia]